METGKILSLVAGIMTLVATFFFSWITISIGGNEYFVNGIGIIQNLPAMFTDAESLGSTLDIPDFSLYIIAGIFILFLVSGVLQILGMKSRTLGIIGTLVSLGIISLIWLGSANVIDEANWVQNILGTNDPIIWGWWPFNMFGPDVFDFGMYLLYAGGIVGIVASVYGPGPF